jgi:glycosyltransferase involved in cell wall biosynthesis
MKVSVILPTYNGSNFIANAIRSVLNQSLKDYEFLIIDDGSTDNTAEIVDRFAAIDGRIRHLRNDANQGLEKSLNRGLQLAKGKYIARIDDDDVWTDKDKLKNQVEFLDGHPNHVLVGTGCIIVDEQGTEIHRHSPPSMDSQIRKTILSSTVFYHSTVMFSRLMALHLGGYTEEKYHAASDYDLWLRLGTLGGLANLPTFAVAYTMRPGNMCSNKNLCQLKDILLIINKYRQAYPHYLYSLLWRCLQYFAFATIGYLRYPRIKKRITSNIDRIFGNVKHIH